jgi:spoIIIJ-associated protein
MSDRLIQRGQQWLEKILDITGFSANVKIEQPETVVQNHPSQEESPSYWLTIDQTQLTPEQVDTLIGPEGATLDAIQYLANSILNLNQEREEQASYTIELNGYRLRRQAELRAVAEYAAEKVRETGQEYEIKSLSSAERRQVHTFLQDCQDLETFSRGQEPDRRLVVRLL